MKFDEFSGIFAVRMIALLGLEPRLVRYKHTVLPLNYKANTFIHKFLYVKKGRKKSKMCSKVFIPSSILFHFPFLSYPNLSCI